MIDLKALFNRVFGFLSKGTEVSYSKISAYLYCPEKFRLLYVEGKFVQPTPAISLGQSIHKTLEDFHSNKYDGPADLFDCYDRLWVNEGFNNPQQTLDFYNKGRRMLENYWETARDMKCEILYVEKDFSFKMGKHRVRGIIDRIDRHPDGRYEVIDYKTHSEMWSRDRIDNDLQLSIYALACKESLGFSPDTLSLYFLAHGQKVSTERSPEKLEEARKLMVKVAEKIAGGEYQPNKANCKGCDMRNACKYNAAAKGKSPA